MQDTAVVTLDSLGFKVASYQKSDQAVFGSRFGSGGVDETDLTLLKTLTFEATQDGSFSNMQKPLNPYIASGRANYKNNTLLSPVKVTTVTQSVPTTVGSESYVHDLTATCIWQGFTILAYRVYNKNYLYKYNKSNNTLYSITIPTALRDSTQAITSFSMALGVLMIISPIASGMWYLNVACDTVTLVASGGAWVFKQAFNLNNKMYLMDAQNAIWEFTGTISTVTYTLITTTQYFANATDFTIYNIDNLNGRSYIAFSRAGLWCFDGVRAYVVIDGKGTVNGIQFPSTIDYLAACSGYIYFCKRNIIYRFNGSSIEKLYILPNDTIFQSICSVDDIVYIQTRAFYTDEISVKYKKTPVAAISTRIYSFDGVNLYLAAFETFPVDFEGKGMLLYMVAAQGGLLSVAIVGARNSYPSVNIIHDLTFDSTADTPLSFIFNREEMNLPNVNKLIQSVRLAFLDTLNLTGTSSTIKLYYRLNEVADWVLCKTFSTNLSEYLGALDVAIPSSKRFYFRLEIGGTNIQFESLSFTYILQPPLKYQWNLLLNPATNTLEAPSAYDNTWAAKIAALRTSSAPFTFVDLNGTSYSAIVDSFVQKIDPTYSGTSNNYESQFSVVLREV